MLRVVLLMILTFASADQNFNCSNCKCLRTPHYIQIYCLGHTISEFPRFEETIRRNTSNIYIVDSRISVLNANLCAWDNLLTLHLSGNENFNCSSLFRTVHSCIEVYGDCAYDTSTRYIPTTRRPRHFKPRNRNSIITISVFCGVLFLISIILAVRYSRVYRYDIHRTSL